MMVYYQFVYHQSIYSVRMNTSKKSNSSEPNIATSRLFLDLIASKWIICVLFELQEGTKRYSELYKAIADIKQKPLSMTLHKMERDGLITRIVYPVIPPKVEYELSPLGKELIEVMVILGKWSEEHSHRIHQSRTLYDKFKDQPPFWMQPKNPNTSMGL